LRAVNTTRIFPKVPTGDKMAMRRPPTLPPVYPASQEGFKGAAIAHAAPRIWLKTYNYERLRCTKVKTRTIGSKKPNIE
jgi:hypothetical protein